MSDLPLLADQSLELEGTIERVIFHNGDNGFTVLKVALKDGQFQECMVGHMTQPKAGTRMRFRGKYVKNPKFGKQFSFELADEIMPATEEGIRLYLASGLIKGIGKETASRIVEKFGLDSIRILDEEPDKLLKVRGIGKRGLAKICESWIEHRGMRDLLLFLQPHGVSAAYSARIYKAYGGHALRIVQENPYRLAMDIHGIGFLTADAIAGKLGFREDHPLRTQAAVLYLLQKGGDDGHVYLPEDMLVEKVCEQVKTTAEIAQKAILELVEAQRVTREDCANGEIAVYLRRYYHCESKIAFYLDRLLASPKAVRFEAVGEMLNAALAGMNFSLAPEQVKAIESSTRDKALIITGGPGTGKTTIIKAIIKVFEAAKARILLAAPTGRAAKRMAEATGRNAKTIHRMLEYSPKEDRFAKNEDSPLACGLLVVDEASMMDTLLFYHLLKAVPLGATVILVGDIHQLPSVGPGNVLADIIASKTVPVVELNEIFRQSAESEIICNAHLINKGKLPLLESSQERLSDFYFIPKETPEEAAALIVDLIQYHIPRRFGLDPVNDVQLLTPMHKGVVGAENMNGKLQDALNPNALEIKKGFKSFRLHDKVMQVRNNYDKDIFNGDIGRIKHIDVQDKKLSVDFDGIVMPYEFDELDELVPAYAISIHKSQGSEYPAVVIPIMMQHYMLLQRNLVYTGVTRGKKLVVLVGERKALAMAIKNNETSRRFTRLVERLRHES